MSRVFGIVGRKAVASRLVAGLESQTASTLPPGRTRIALLDGGRILQRSPEDGPEGPDQPRAASPVSASVGIGHSDWPGHGVVIDAPGKPDGTRLKGRIGLVWCGRLDNGAEVARELAELGHALVLENHAEAAAHLIGEFLSHRLDPFQAMVAALHHLKGRYGLAMILSDYPGLLLAAQRGAPVILGQSRTEVFIASTPDLISPHADHLTWLIEGDTVEISQSRITIRDRNGMPASRGEA